jgi:fumarylacetoacetase
VTEPWDGTPLDHPFGLDNLPYASLRDTSGRRFAAARLGDHALDLTAAFAGVHRFAGGALDAFLASGPQQWDAVRDQVVAWLTDPAHRAVIEPLLTPLDETSAELGFTVADYVDFYASEHHASNVGSMFRPDGDALTPNWKHLPIGYHGRAGTVVPSGTPIVRPCGQRRGADGPVFGPSVKLDVEAEVGFVVGVPSALGRPVPTAGFRDHVFGFVLVNDWSARDIQAWEYQPLGPFLGKSFATSVSPWVVPVAALESARTGPPAQSPEPLPYLRTDEPWGLEMTLQIELNGHVVSRPPFARMYWTAPQQLAHATVNGAALRTGDLMASGTVSGPTRHERGSLIELTWDGRDPLVLPDGQRRAFLEDGDTVRIQATAAGPDGVPIGFGEVTGTVLPVVC